MTRRKPSGPYEIRGSAAADLVQRIETATGPDRELDFWLGLEFGGVEIVGTHPARVEDTGGELRCYKIDGEPNGWLGYHVSPPVTRSIDAALALAQRASQGASPCIGQNVHHGHWHARLTKLDDEGGPLTVGEADHKVPALAILLAVVNAYPPQANAEEVKQ